MRAKSGVARNWRKKRLFKRAKGFVGGRRKLLKTAKETLLRAGMFSFRDRRAKKRDFRRLWIIRLSAAAEMRGLRYSRFIHGLHRANIELDRKSLSEIAIHDPGTFDTLVGIAREAAAAVKKAAQGDKESKAVAAVLGQALDLLREGGLTYCCDWVNDELP